MVDPYDPSEMLVCPYDPVHRLARKRMQGHLIKCRKVCKLHVHEMYTLSHHHVMSTTYIQGCVHVNTCT